MRIKFSHILIKIAYLHIQGLQDGLVVYVVEVLVVL